MKDELIFQNNIFVSKSIKQIDSSFGFKETIQKKLIKNLRDKAKKLFTAKQKEKIRLKRLKKEQELKKKENNKNNMTQLDLISSALNLQFLPKISPFIKKVDNYLVLDNKKATKLGSKGFEYIWKQDYIRKLMGIDFNKIKNKRNKNKSKKKENININLDDNEDDEEQDIFNKNFKSEDKESTEYIKLKERLNRIINENKKVTRVFNFHKNRSSKFTVKKIYYPKYESIEKHKPEIRLNNKTRRIFPDDFIKKNYYSENNNEFFSTTINNNTFNKKRRFTINNKITKNKRKTFYICSSFSSDNILAQNKKFNENKFSSEVNTNI
jgi:hypothetical protein